MKIARTVLNGESGSNAADLHNKAMLQLKGRDLFNTMNPKTEVRNSAQHLDMNTKSYMQSITLSFSYRFGGYKKKEMKEVDTSRFGN